MQFSHLTIYCFCVLSTIYRCGYLLKAAAKEEDVQDCIVTRVCVLTEPGPAAHCAEKVFTSENATDVRLRLSMETCVPQGRAWPDIGWFMEQPVQRWIAECWNQTQCRVSVEADSRQVWMGVVLGMRKGGHVALVPQACSLTVTSHTGKVKVFHGEGTGLGCGNERSLGTLTDDNTGRELWRLPVSVHHNFHTHTTRGRKEEFVDRDKRDTEGEDTDFLSPASGKRHRPFQSAMKDIIFSDIGDSSDMFTGELTPDEEVWNADLPETLGPVMTFPDDYMERIGLSKSGKQAVKGKKSEKWGLKTKVLPPVKEMPQFSPSNNLLPMRTVEEEVGGEPQPAPSPQGLEGRDMMMSLEENIDNKLHSSLSSLLQDQQARSKEELSLVASLALENKVSDVLASVEKEPNSVLTPEGDAAVIQQQRPVAGRGEDDNEEERPAPVLDRLIEDHNLRLRFKPAENNKNKEGDDQTKVETLAKSLPPPDQTLSSISKPRLPPPNTTTQASTIVSLPNNNTAVTNLSSDNFNQSDSSLLGNASSDADQSGSASADPSLSNDTIATASIPMDMADSGPRGPLMSPQPPPGAGPGRQKGIQPALSPSDQQTLKDNVLKAEALFQKSFDHLKMEMKKALRVSLRPGRKKFLNAIEPGILRWGHTTAWAMVKQVCKDALLKMRTGDSSWQEWSLWSPCTLTCGNEGYQIRHRSCQTLHECLGSNYDLRTCDSQPPCQGSSAWLDWAEWGACSVTCGSGGVQFRMRTCLTDDPGVVCQGSGTEFSPCSPSPCAVMNNTTMPNHQDPQQAHHPQKKHIHVHHHHHSHPKKEKKPHPPVTVPKPSTTTTTTTIIPDQPDHRKRHKRPHGRRKMLARRPRGPDTPPPDQLEPLSVLDDVINDLQGVQEVKDKDSRKKSDLMPLEAYKAGKLMQDPGVPEPQRSIDDSSNDLSDVSWSVWGMWSQCSVSCDRGTEFRRRQCIRRKEGSLDGGPVNTVLCTGKSRDRRMCVLFPCPISVAIPKTLAMLNEGSEGRLNCRHEMKGKVRFMYWITPSGEVINNSTEDGKYVMQGGILSIHRAQKSDLGHYQCVLVSFSNIGQPSVNTSAEAQTEKEELGTCLENPCENGGMCEDDSHQGPYAQIAPFHYHCTCPEGFFGKHCEQKSLVHQYTPNLKIMGMVLLGLIALLFITCTFFCVYYGIEWKGKENLDLGPVMTRRRSEDQWRKMKSFDHKARSRKKSFSSKAIRRLSRILTGKNDDPDEEHSHSVKFGLNTSPYSELAKTLEDAGTEVEELSNDLTCGAGMKDISEEDNVSQNASPLTVAECDSECESPGELQGNQAQSPAFQDSERYQSEFPYSQNCQIEYMGSQSCPTKLQDTERHHSKFQSTQRHPDDSENNRNFHSDDRDRLRYETERQDNPNRVVIQLHDSKLYVDFQGDQKQTVKFPSKQELQIEKQAIQFQDSQKQSLQPLPTIIYSDDKMEIFSDSSLLHLKGLENRLKQESYSPFLGSCGESPMNPTTYIYRSQVSLDPKDRDLSSVPSAFSDRPRCKRRSKKWSRRTSSVEHEFNQNNSDDSNDGSHQLPGEQAESEEARFTNHAADHDPSPSGQRSSRSDRGHQSASRYSSTDSGEESDNAPQAVVCGRGCGARPKVRHGPWHKVRSDRPRTSVADTQARGGQDCPQSHTLLPLQDHHRQVTYSTEGGGAARPAYMMYEVHHPDEPYPFRQARSRRKSREGTDGPGSGPASRSAQTCVQRTPDSGMTRPQDALSPSASAQVSVDTGVPQQRPSATSPQQLRYLEGGGEGASALVRTDSRKSGRDVLLRRAMENSFIQATTGHEPWRPAFPNRKRSASPDGDPPESSDGPARSQCGQPEQSVASAEPESFPSPQWLAATLSVPQVRTEHQPGLTPRTQPLAAAASGHHPLTDHARLEDSMPAGSISPQPQSDPHLPTSVCSFLHQAHKAHQQKGTADGWSGHSGAKCAAADWFNFTKKAGVSRGSFNLLQPRTYTLEADSDAPSASGSGSVFSGLNPASTSQETRRTMRDRAAEEGVARAPVSSPSGVGRAWRRARLMTETRNKNYAESQPPLKNWPSMNSHSETSKDQTSTSASTSTAQDSSSALLGQFSMSDCLHRSQTKVLKSALKQRCSPSKLAPAEMRAQPLRRVSFSEPHIHIHNSIDSVLEEGGLRWSSDVSMGTGQNSAAQNDSAVDSRWRRCAFPQLDTLSAALPSAAHGEQVFPPTSGRGGFNHQPTSSSSSPTGSSWLSSFVSSRQESVLQLSDTRQGRARGSSWHPTGTNTNTSSPPASRSRNCCPSGTAQASHSAWASSESSAVSRTSETTAESEDQSWSLQSSLLVDIEPDSSAHKDFRSARSVFTDRGNSAAAPPPLLSSQGLLTPLTPCPAQDNPSRAGQQDREWQSDVMGGGGEGSGRTEAAEAGPNLPTELGLSSAVSFRSFQEMLAQRSPGAFFRPIGRTDRPHQSHH